MPTQVRDIASCPVDPGEFAKMAAVLGYINWRPVPGSSEPGWPEDYLPRGRTQQLLCEVFRPRGREFYCAATRLGLLGGVFRHREQLRDFITEIDGCTLVSDALLRAAAVCAVIRPDGKTTFDLADLQARARWFSSRAGKDSATK